VFVVRNSEGVHAYLLKCCRGTCSSVGMLKGYMVRERLGTPVLKRHNSVRYKGTAHETYLNAQHMLRYSARIHTQPFNDRVSHYSGSCIFGYNSAPAAKRGVQTLYGCGKSSWFYQKKHFFIRVRGSPGGGSQSGGVFVFLTNFDTPWTPIPWAKILAQTCVGN